MKRQRLIGAAVAMAVALAMLGATDASAKKGPVAATFTTKGSKGYAISVYGFDKNVGVTATAKNGASATYSVNGTVSGSTLKATWKGFGKVSMKFHKKGKPKTINPPKGCTGPKTIVQNGVWKGKFKFKGENGYTKASAKKAKGSTTQASSTKPYNCNGGGGGGGGKPKKCVTLTQFDKKGSFSAQRINGDKSGSFSIFESSKKGSVSIFRSGFAVGVFDYDLKKQTATLKPSSPFSGTGKFANGKISGSLKAKLPGDTKAVKGNATLSDGTCYAA